jgi:hypothetical protein
VLCTVYTWRRNILLATVKSSVADVPPVRVPQLPIAQAVSGRTAVWSATAIVSGDTAAEMGRTARSGCCQRADRPLLGTA